LSPIEQSRELDPLNAAFDTKTEEEAVKMCFDGALGNVKIPSDF